MKKFTSVILAIATFILCFTLSACGSKYSSHYSSSLMVESINPTEASVSFDKFNGTYVIKLTNKGSDEVVISYKATLKEGNITVYYDFNDEKLTMFKIGTNGSFDEKTEAFTGNKTIYIIVQSDGNCNEGSFSFVLEKSAK